MAVVEVACRYCGRTDQVSRYGKGCAGHQRYRCMNCNKSVQLAYAYEAYKVGVEDQIVDMAMNGSGVRDTMSVLKIGINAVIRTLKNSPRKQ